MTLPTNPNGHFGLKMEDHSYSPAMDVLFGSIYGIRNVRMNMTYFEELKNNGIHLIKDPVIKKALVNLFEDTYEYLGNLLDSERRINQVTRSYYLHNFVNIEFCRKATPIDYHNVWNDPTYKNIVHYRIITLKSNQVNWYQKAIQQINYIVKSIDTYLQNQ